MAGLFSIEVSNHDSLYCEVERISETHEGPRLYISRLPQRAMLRHVSLDEVECLWITEQQTKGAIAPTVSSLSERLFSFVESSDSGFSVIEGLIWIVQRDGIEAAMQMLQALESKIYETNHTVLFRVDALALDAIKWARIRSIAPAIDHSVSEVLSEPKSSQLETIANEEFDQLEDSKQPLLVHLTTIPSLGFTSSLLSKRILQWKRMGFDVSELEPALSFDDSDTSHSLYIEVEKKIRKAIDLSRLLEANLENYSVTTYEVTMFRIMQLTGLDEIESMLLNHSER